ncbi:N-acetylglucosamine-6-phosphate deacetylase [Pseudalkalibacillus caeni]|uniref:N-acetylglucosamine-6-phosphate deacetylase n=1 Tax=Exobacillus caeni TaxID=2574798 RepID=A0A5R9FGV0_9BACL|nr:N-acetylglucosamine-6-phosphate deacetylase [Pseudalkalibacillus caeni]TLS38765.1 N-acetylglucosamine-6-phosphate deacetylase [Pseudalkalibacillus caeni]
MSCVILKDIRMYVEDSWQTTSAKIKGGKIIAIGPFDELEEPGASSISFEQKVNAVPGMIDVHIHGASGADTMDATTNALETIAQALAGEGTTSFLATTITQSRENIEKALSNAADFIENHNNKGAEVVGVHLEGPFISEKRAGAQPLKDIINPDIELFKQWQQLAGGNIRLVTMAPEETNGLELAAYLKETGVVASIGHSDATFEQVEEAVKAGVTHATHLFNGMKGMHHREPGVVGGVMLNDKVTAEIISDGIHVRPEMIKLTYRQKGKDRLILITDAMRAKCLGPGSYDLGGQEVTVSEDKAVLEDGTLAGSILKMKDAASNMMEFTGCGLEDIVRMTAVNPAKQLGIFDRKGSIAVGKDADIVILNEDNDVLMTLCKGTIAYEKEEGE